LPAREARRAMVRMVVVFFMVLIGIVFFLMVKCHPEAETPAPCQAQAVGRGEVPSPFSFIASSRHCSSVPV